MADLCYIWWVEKASKCQAEFFSVGYGVEAPCDVKASEAAQLILSYAYVVQWFAVCGSAHLVVSCGDLHVVVCNLSAEAVNRATNLAT